jgi:hypothetical protein
MSIPDLPYPLIFTLGPWVHDRLSAASFRWSNYGLSHMYMMMETKVSTLVSTALRVGWWITGGGFRDSQVPFHTVTMLTRG